MQRSRIKNKQLNQLLLFVQKYWLLLIVLLGVAMAVPFFVRFFKKQNVITQTANLENAVKVNSAQNATVNPTIQKKKANAFLTKYPNLKKADLHRLETYAHGIAKALGVDAWNEHPLFGVDFLPLVFDKWDEDEEEVVRILKKVPGTFPIVADLYYSVYTRSRNLKTDLLKYLDKSDLNKVRATYKQYKKVWI